jgi:GAF domain-containing protein
VPRRSTAGGKLLKVRRRKTAPLKRRAAVKAARPRSADAVEEIEVKRLKRELKEALEQQAATADILKSISSSTFDLQAVLEALVKTAVRLCAADAGHIALPEGEDYRTAAATAMSPQMETMVRAQSYRPGRGTAVGRALAERRVVQIADIGADREHAARQAAAAGYIRTILAVPLLRQGEPIGAFGLARSRVEPFTKRQIELVSTFATQAVIAIENARLLSELRQRTTDLTESLEQQTATSEVLRVISSSPGDLQPVFATILENATRICQANFGTLYFVENGAFRVAAIHNAPAAFVEARRREPLLRVQPGNPMERAATTKRAVQIADIADDPHWLRDDPHFQVFTALTGARSLVTVPLLKDNEALGVITVYRLDVRPFGDKQTELLMNFAAQAVIAIENTRLLSELRESLDQQTATSKVLEVISSSPGELQPVFNAMLENATRICEAKFGALFLFDGKVFRFAAEVDTPLAYAVFQKQRESFLPGPGTFLDQVMRTMRVCHSADYAAEAVVGNAAKLGGARSTLGVPLLKDDVLVGAMFIYRQEVRPFSDKQIALVQNFAAQAVIAIENTRLLSELRESLEQQTATSKVLEVISASPGELEPVFQAMLENAVRICNAGFGNLALFDGHEMRMAVMHNAPPQYEALRQDDPVIPLDRSIMGPLVRTKAVVHINDLAADTLYANSWLAKLAGARTAMAVPMLREDELVGAIALYHQEVRPFTDKQIALIQNFAAQAVIAIENTRLLSELRESLDQQTATSKVLEVISSSPGELQPVFQAMLENATRICEAKFGTLALCEGDALRAVALHGGREDYADERRRNPVFRPAPNVPVMRAVRTKQVQHVADMLTEQAYIDRDAAIVTMVETGGARTFLAVPMLKEDEAVGVIIIYRREVLPFTDKQIALIQNFAAQAVIAIENTRLLNELRESLQQQTATADVLKVISRSTFDLRTVLDTLVESAARLCEADTAAIRMPKDGGYQHVASYGILPDYIEAMRTAPLKPGRSSTVGRVLLERRTVHIHDVCADPDIVLLDIQRARGLRTALGVPLMRDGAPIGILFLSRNQVKPFTDKQIELVETFADQAVIAIENVRLFEAEQERTRELAKSLEDLRTAQDRLVQTEKLASLGQLTAGIAHEIKNPLNFVNNFSGLSVELIDELAEGLKEVALDDKQRTEFGELTETLRENLQRVVQHGQRADSIVKNMLLHSREGAGERRAVDINALVEESLNLAYHGARAEKQGFNITLERSFDPAAGDAELFPQEITRVLLNLISNGFYAANKRRQETGDGGYEPTLAASTKSLGDRVEIRIRDNGTGIPPEVKDKMFNPFFTTKPAGEGTGLGLSLSHDIIVKQHSGAIEVDTEPGAFTEIRIVLPRAAAAGA